MSRVLTFDLGTSYFKVCLFDETLQLVACQREATPIQRSVADRAELPVAAFERSLTKAVHELNRRCGGFGDVKKVCFASQANSFTLLDAADRPLLPFIIWTDQRARGLEESWRSLIEHPEFYLKTGVAKLDHHFMVAKLHWLRKFEPGVIARARRVCGIADYLVRWLTGNHLTEAGLVGITGLADIHALEYWGHALQNIGFSTESMPDVVRAGSDAGELRTEIAHEWGLPADCRLVMGCLDQYAGAIGAGNMKPGGVSETTGTVLATVRCAAEFATSAPPGVFQGPAFKQGLYYQMVFGSTGAGLLEKYRNSLPDRLEFDQLDKLASEVPTGSEGLRLHPQASTMTAKDMFVGRSTVHHRGYEARAIMEAVAVALREQIATLCGEEWPSVVRSVGGAARSRVWRQIKCKTVGCRFETVDCDEPAGLGAARLASLSS